MQRERREKCGLSKGAGAGERGFQRAGEKMVESDLARLFGNLGATISYNKSFLVTAAFVNYLLRHNFCLTATCNCKIFMATEVAS